MSDLNFEKMKRCTDCEKLFEPEQEYWRWCSECNLKKYNNRPRIMGNVLFNPVIATWNDNWDGDPNEDPYIYEGIPNYD